MLKVLAFVAVVAASFLSYKVATVDPCPETAGWVIAWIVSAGVVPVAIIAAIEY